MNSMVRLVILGTVLLIVCSCTSRSGGIEKRGASTPSPEQQAIEEIDRGAYLIDVRRPDEYAKGHLEGAVNIPHDQIATQLDALAPYRDKSIVLYCASGRRAGLAQQVLRENGFTKVLNAGGYAELSSQRR